MECDICPFLCQLENDEIGRCRSYINKNSKIISLCQNKITTMILGPIEQKPIYHFFPGSVVLSVGTYGCNLKCRYCQNFEISQTVRQNSVELSAKDIIDKAIETKANGIAFTYNEPVMWIDEVIEICSLARKNNLKTIIKTNGYVNEKYFTKLVNNVDAINIDIKGNRALYKDICDISLSENISDWQMIKNLSIASKKCHVEISMIAIEPYCHEMNEYYNIFSEIKKAAGYEVPIHILMFVPYFGMRHNKTTSDNAINALSDLAKQQFRYVYIDYTGSKNINTFCECGFALISRNGIKIESINLKNNRFCPSCNCEHNFIGV